MDSYSTTQLANLGVIAGLISLVLSKVFHVSIAAEEITTFLGAALIAVSSIASWINRYKKGDLHPIGTRKFR